MKHRKPRPHKHKKKRKWKLSGIVSVILGVVGAVGVIELRPQITVSPQDPIEKTQPFSVPFRIENAGYFSFRLERAFCYYGEVRVGNIQVNEGLSHSLEWNHHTLDRSEGETILCNLVHYPAVPSAADIAVVVDYKPFRFFPWPFRTYRRFVGAFIDNWQWTPQASETIQDSADRAIAEHLKRHPG